MESHMVAFMKVVAIGDLVNTGQFWEKYYFLFQAEFEIFKDKTGLCLQHKSCKVFY